MPLIQNSFLLIFALVCLGSTYAQNDSLIALDSNALELQSDSVLQAKQKTHSPLKATLFSTFVPGLGQIYNRKYWKVPIIYGAIGTATYFALKHKDQYELYKNAYIARFDQDATNDSFLDTNTTTLNDLQSQTRSNMERMYVLAGVLYLLNIIDACVDAHLFHFDVSDDLSMHVGPEFYDPRKGLAPNVNNLLSLSIKL